MAFDILDNNFDVKEPLKNRNIKDFVIEKIFKKIKAISYKSDLANPYNPKICTLLPHTFL